MEETKPTVTVHERVCPKCGKTYTTEPKRGRPFTTCAECRAAKKSPKAA